MESSRLLECLEADYTRLREVAIAADLSAIVPSCPDWTVADLVQHVGMVYAHKVECMRLGDHPTGWPPAHLQTMEPVALLDTAYADLAAEFAKRDPADETFTWYGPDQTVGFWIRRMAQESVIHRVDGELGAGVAIREVPADLAEDGIDELLVAFVEYGSREWPDEFGDLLSTADGRAVRIATDARAWSVRITPQGVEVTTAEPGTAESGTGESGDPDDGTVAAAVHGAASDLLLWLWNRVDSDQVGQSGDLELIGRLRAVLAASTG